MKNKVLTFLLSLAISFGLWLYVVMVISPESEATYYNVPVELVGMDKLSAHNLLIVSDTNMSMDLTLRGNRADLSKLSNSNITILADVSRISSAGEHQLKYDISYPGVGSVEVLNKEPEQISVLVAQQLRKTIPVEVTFAGNVVSGYEVDKTTVSLDHTTVTIHGPMEVVQKIAYAGITVDLTGKMSTFVWDYPLILYSDDYRPVSMDKYLVSNVENVRAIIQVNRVKKIPIVYKINPQDSGLLPEMVTVYPSVQEITVTGSDTALDQLNEVKLGEIALSNLTASTTLEFALRLPEGVVCKEGITTVNMDVNIPEMGQRVMQVTTFDNLNLPQGLQVGVNRDYTVTLWGPLVYLNELSEDAVVGTIDCTDLKVDSLDAPISFAVKDHEYLRIHSDWKMVSVSVTETAEEG